MRNQIPVSESPGRPGRPESRVLRRSGTNEVVADLACKRVAIVNIVFYGPEYAPDRGWVLIDAGMPGTARLILRAAEKRYGRDSRPAAIILTHGHFDHVGALQKLADHWDVPIFAHPFEMPYLEGTSRYPSPEPPARGGLIHPSLPSYTNEKGRLGKRLKPLEEGEIPFMPGWIWIHSPGHSPGHISLWRETDRVLIAGDALITTSQESAYSVAVQQPELHGPPISYTPDWDAARYSVQRLAELDPEWLVTGHGPPMNGEEMRVDLRALAADFDQLALPQERYFSKAV